MCAHTYVKREFVCTMLRTCEHVSVCLRVTRVAVCVCVRGATVHVRAQTEVLSCKGCFQETQGPRIEKGPHGR